ncbi:M1 family aminopeptidase [Nocardioides acrostichi]|uniref:Peptidase M1 membrane alanine aminopeptidase domain-containing protein n=1 Tax=Nocardioides acrostichi TaxID=2784339 RepID=A0A930UZ03_9ACTN|nr:M1 family metallopeptidase [Nocardioides acrostichi]MBF4162327.1 hypothetical protein [Nocardioides acrostichi]
MTIPRALRCLLAGCSASLLLLPLTGAAAGPPDPRPGGAGVGDPYFPTDGNGGYEVDHYDLDVAYLPTKGRIRATATISATSLQRMSRFHLDLEGLRVQALSVNGEPAQWTRDGGELIVTPATRVPWRSAFTVVVTYAGTPDPHPSRDYGGWQATKDGAVVAGQPHSASRWFPNNDHPSDPATYTLHVSAPSDLDVVSNGSLTGKETADGWTTWTYDTPQPMASYLVTLAIGHYETTERTVDGLHYLDAIDEGLLEPVAEPSSGTHLAASGTGRSVYRRLTRTFDVPADGARLSFDLTRLGAGHATAAFVEAHTVGQGDWTTLPDLNGHTRTSVRVACDFTYDFPFLARHYLTLNRRGCSGEGRTGEWNGRTGSSDGAERWAVDLGGFAGSRVEVSITYLADYASRADGLFVDDVTFDDGTGSPQTTSFETGLEGWTPTGPPPGSPHDTGGWTALAGDDAVSAAGRYARAAFEREPEVIAFLQSVLGPYPFTEVGGIVPDHDLGYALETQTRPIYDPLFFDSEQDGLGVFAHELAHQWYGDAVPLRRWKSIWLNEGFATYAAMLWEEHAQGRDIDTQIRRLYRNLRGWRGFWQVEPGAPGPRRLFDGAVYSRGALAVHALREKLGDHAFFEVLRGWPEARAHQPSTIRGYENYVEATMGVDVTGVLKTWLFTKGRPAAVPQVGSDSSRTADAAEGAAPLSSSVTGRLGDRITGRISAARRPTGVS